MDQLGRQPELHARAEIAESGPGIEELVEVVSSAATTTGSRIKVVGSGHSFTDAACTDGTLIQLDHYRRLVAVDRERCQVTVQAGMTIADLNSTLALYGMALPNLGDIEYQTISGALATATHGTGSRLGCLATQVVAAELVTADGSVRSLSADDDGDAFEAARVSIGALGAVSTLTLQCVPAFNLHAVEEPLRLDEALESFDELADGNDHMEFYWMPHSRWVILKRNNRVEGPERRRPRLKEWYDDIFFQNTLFGLLGKVQMRKPEWVRPINRALPKPSRLDYIQRSDRVFTTPRRVRFCEMEYGFARVHAREVIGEVRDFLTSSGLQIGFPIEVRVAAADDIPAVDGGRAGQALGVSSPAMCSRASRTTATSAASSGSWATSADAHTGASCISRRPRRWPPSIRTGTTSNACGGPSILRATLPTPTPIGSSAPSRSVGGPTVRRSGGPAVQPSGAAEGQPPDVSRARLRVAVIP